MQVLNCNFNIGIVERIFLRAWQVEEEKFSISSLSQCLCFFNWISKLNRIHVLHTLNGVFCLFALR